MLFCNVKPVKQIIWILDPGYITNIYYQNYVASHEEISL